MKLSLAILFLTFLLLCGVLLRAANPERKLIRVQKAQQEVTTAKVPNDMLLLPNVIIL